MLRGEDQFALIINDEHIWLVVIIYASFLVMAKFFQNKKTKELEFSMIK